MTVLLSPRNLEGGSPLSDRDGDRDEIEVNEVSRVF